MTAPDRPGVLAPPPLIYLSFLLVGWLLTHVVADPGLGLEPQVRRYAAFALIIGGLVLEGVAVGQFRSIGTRPEPWKPTTALVTNGLYRFSRNPIYIGFALMYAGFATAMDSLIALALVLPCLVVVDRFVILPEERYLSGKFGADYDAYRSKVRRWL
ncbi:methyltransferase family protein [Brevundimonas lenta]|uniref:Protein-S-isoprenylcysteine O-methyltransferase Ste14 n=1 Tax=Brevundimonas lenta TaxID=424796 RepID=A0A7W6JD89_9CAUL|nr:isoprenylcysteine carboxylmethyltransferase family protein [Brevundimonas lenta]MBB4082006.1 protein-S-isoprenylcysteine O-methyltransferase Ste14 [Brevundimonas lenta]